MNRWAKSTFLASGVVIAGLCFGPALAFEDQAADGWPGWQAVSQVELDATRAKGHIFDFEATISGNGIITVSGDATNTIDNHAFAHFSGLANVIQNNGNGAIIQAGIAVTVNVFP